VKWRRLKYLYLIRIQLREGLLLKRGIREPQITEPSNIKGGGHGHQGQEERKETQAAKGEKGEVGKVRRAQPGLSSAPALISTGESRRGEVSLI